MKKRKILTAEEMKRLNEQHKIFAEENFKLGRKVFRNYSGIGYNKTKIGYVVREWPNTEVIFLDGSWCTVWPSNYGDWKFTQEYDTNFSILRKKLGEKKRKAVSRKDR